MEEIRKQKEKIRAEVMQLLTMQQGKLIEEVNQLRAENEELRKIKNNYSNLEDRIRQLEIQKNNTQRLLEKLKEDKIISKFEDGDYGYDEYGNGGGYHIFGYVYNNEPYEIYAESL
ncbi:hypothetical protein BSK20_03690 [SR1 bacterium human oral taxon HOT-345]|nr:hypothetical protein BSK20_03690 [SR1 bacterium human oral taxon HOT-345]